MVYGKLKPLEKVRETSVAIWYYFLANCFLVQYCSIACLQQSVRTACVQRSILFCPYCLPTAYLQPTYSLPTAHLQPFCIIPARMFVHQPLQAGTFTRFPKSITNKSITNNGPPSNRGKLSYLGYHLSDSVHFSVILSRVEFSIDSITSYFPEVHSSLSPTNYCESKLSLLPYDTLTLTALPSGG
jgi:hypothetical protein